MHPRIAACACLVAAFLGACTTSRVTELYGGRESVHLLQPFWTPLVTVTAWRIADERAEESGGAAGDPWAHGYVVLAPPIAVDEALAAEISDVLTSDATYVWDSAKACEFMPGLMLRWSYMKMIVDVLVCFSCDELQVWRDSQLVGHEDFDPRRPDLVRAAKRLFPGDARIQALGEKR